MRARRGHQHGIQHDRKPHAESCECCDDQAPSDSKRSRDAGASAPGDVPTRAVARYRPLHVPGGQGPDILGSDEARSGSSICTYQYTLAYASVQYVRSPARFAVPLRNGRVNFVLSVKSRDRQGPALRSRRRSPRLGSAGSAPPRSVRDANGGHHRVRRRRDDALSHVPLAPTTGPADGVPLAWHRRVSTTQFARRGGPRARAVT